MNSTQTAITSTPTLTPEQRLDTPHRMVSRLLEGAVRRLQRAEDEIRRHEHESLRAAVAIVEALQDSLDLVRGGQLAANLFDLYDYMLRRLAVAREHADADPLREVAGLLDTIREGWDAIASEV